MILVRAGFAIAALILLSVSDRVLAQKAPANGTEVLRAMHDAYAGKWYTTLTFTQKTTNRRKDGSDTVSTWHESLRYTPAEGTRLRIDIGDLADGKGVLYSGDSTWVVRGGAVVNRVKGGNELLPLIEGVYVQPIERTLAEIAPANVDLTRPVIASRWNDRPVWIVGATSVTDTTSPQFWVDSERKIMVRGIMVPAPNAPPMDMRLDGVVKVDGGWLATKCSFLVGGAPVQVEEYSGWQVNQPLPASLFDLAQWTTGPHWARK